MYPKAAPLRGSGPVRATLGERIASRLSLLYAGRSPRAGVVQSQATVDVLKGRIRFSTLQQNIDDLVVGAVDGMAADDAVLLLAFELVAYGWEKRAAVHGHHGIDSTLASDREDDVNALLDKAQKRFARSRDDESRRALRDAALLQERRSRELAMAVDVTGLCRAVPRPSTRAD